MILKTPFGRLAYAVSSAISIAALGALSDGLRIKVLPQAIEIGNIQSGIIAGKLKGAIPPHTPNGSLYEYVSIPLDTFICVSPIVRLLIDTLCSSTSNPLYKSPFASTAVFPCSLVICCINLDSFYLIRPCNSNKYLYLAIIDVSFQP